MKSNFKQIVFALFFGISAIILIAWKEYEPDTLPDCEELVNRNGKIAIAFTAGQNIYRNPSYEYYIPSPDMRWNDIPGQSITDQTKFTCTVNVTSPNCPSFHWSRSFENPGNIMNIQLPPSSFDATIKVTYIERGEDFSTFDFNKPATDMFGNPKNYSRVKYQFQRTYLGGWSNPNIVETLYLVPTENEGYNVDPATGKMLSGFEGVPAGGKMETGDLSGINVFIDLGN